MDLNKPITVTPLTVLKWLGVFLLVLNLFYTLYTVFLGGDLNKRYKDVQRAIKRSEISFDSIMQLRNGDSIYKVKARDSIAELIVLRKQLEIERSQYKNQWFKLYKKYEAEANNYTDADSKRRDSIAAAIAKQ